ncbi:MAG: S41 family peptidase [Bacteroidales bacterium]
MLKPMKEFFKNRFVRTILLVVLITSVAAGTTATRNSDFEIAKNLEIFANLLKKLHTNYVDDIKVGALMETGIKAVLEELDPYTVYVPESKIEDYKLMTTGAYGGIGSTIQQRDDYVVVAQVYQGFAADKAGLKPGDKIIQVDGDDARGKTTDEVSSMLKGQAGSSISITVQRMPEKDPIQLTLTREKIEVPNIPYSGIVDQNIGYIKLSSFTPGAAQEVKEAYVKLKEQHQLDAVVLDLRNNGGGLLGEAVKIVNLFVPKGEMVVETRGKLPSKNKTYRTQTEPLDTIIPLAVMVNGNSASASEIVAGAIQDLDRGIIVGENTFGKGLVQNILPLSYNSRMKVTVARYFIPSGRCVQAIDYANRNKRISQADSLRKIFKTRNGRDVYDGDGIYPDVQVSPDEYNTVSRELLAQNMIFDFATVYYYQHDSINAPEVFDLSDESYQAFSSFLDKKEFNYQTKTEKQLQKLKETAKDEQYLASINSNLTDLKGLLKHNKNQDLTEFRDEIQHLLELEIVGRYFYRRGKAIYGLKDDKQMDQVLSLLTNRSKYREILKPDKTTVNE